MDSSHSNMDASTIEMVSAMIASHKSEHGLKSRLISLKPACFCGKLHRSLHFGVVESALKTMLKNHATTSVHYYTEKTYCADGTKEKKYYFLFRLSTGTFWNVIIKNDDLICFQQVFQHDVADGMVVYGGGAAAGLAVAADVVSF